MIAVCEAWAKGFLSTLSLRRATRSYTRPYRSVLFLSTLSLRRATVLVVPSGCWLPISIHALLAESDPFTEHDVNSALISIHALLAESDFAGRLPSRRGIAISIHALLAESDLSGLVGAPLAQDFYPRSPCGERLANLRGLYSEAIFLSTLSLRRATRILSTSRAFSVISIHALLAESDSLPVWCYPTQ